MRLSYQSALPGLEDVARSDAAELLGVAIEPEQVVGFAAVEWTRARRRPSVPGLVQVGESVAGTGLASVVAQARGQAAELLAGPLGSGGSTGRKSRSVVPGKENNTE